MKPLIIIPARMASTRLPGKPLADIHGKTMIEHVYARASESGAGAVYVACAEAEIADVITRAGGKAVLTDPDLPSGTDRVFAAANSIDPDGAYDVIVNLQGDMPTLGPDVITKVLGLLSSHPDCDIATAAVMTDEQEEKDNPNVVKAALGSDGRALYFSRAHIPTGAGPVWHHVGIYAYRRAALERFCALPPTPLERRERLEQLRALEAGMVIFAAILESAPNGVDTPADLFAARAYLEGTIK